jgi:hypothetical protein
MDFFLLIAQPEWIWKVEETLFWLKNKIQSKREKTIF